MTKTALITGGVRRLGGHISLHLASKGYDLAVLYNNSSSHQIDIFKSRISKFDINYNLYKCDLNNLNSINQTSDLLMNDYDKIDLLLNNAGIIKKVNFHNMSSEDYDQVMNVNLKGTIFFTQSVLPLLTKTNNSSIINIASLGGLKNWTTFFPYSLSKTGLIKATYLMAKELAPDIRVNAIAPGTIEIPDEPGEVDDTLHKDKIPINRWGTPEDINKAIDMLISCEYITGQVITVDGGRTLI